MQVTEPLRLVGPVGPVKGGAAVYIVKLRQPGAASYKSVPMELTGEKPSEQAQAARASAANAYAQTLEQSHDRLLGNIGAANAKVYSYRYSVNGFAARLTAAQVSRLAQSAEVERIWRDTDQYLRTNNSPAFLGLQDPVGGLRADLGLRGEGIVVGVIDSGVAPNHPSLRDTEDRTPRACRSEWSRTSLLGIWLCTSYRRNPPSVRVYDPPIGFTGACQAGPGFEPSHCNNKIVGARFYLDGFLAQHELDPGEIRSPKDADGHGTHIATIIAGNSVDATLLGTRVGRISGIAPRARIAVYKACWLEPGSTRGTCTTSDLVRAIDDAVADGVDLINYSVGSLETELDAPDDLALLDALDAGVLTVVAAGNDGPELDTIGSPSSAPWVLDDGRLDARRRVLRRWDRDHGAGRLGLGDRNARGLVHAAADARRPDRGAACRGRRRRRHARRHCGRQHPRRLRGARRTRPRWTATSRSSSAAAASSRSRSRMPKTPARSPSSSTTTRARRSS